MGIMGRLGLRKAKEKIVKVVKKEEPSWVKKTCYKIPGLTKKQRDELYGIARELIFLEPCKIDLSYEEAKKRAIEFEKNGDTLRARVHRHIAAGLAFYNGNKEGAKENIEAYAKLLRDEQFGRKALEYLDILFQVQTGYVPAD